jgi:hypothetical protein
MHAQVMGEVATGFQPIPRLQSAVQDALAELVANLHIQRLAQARIQRDEHGGSTPLA